MPINSTNETNQESLTKINCYTTSIDSKHNSMSLISHLTSSFLAAASSSSSSSSSSTIINKTSVHRPNLNKRNSLNRNLSVTDDHLTSSRNSTSSISSLVSCHSTTNKTANSGRNSCLYVENDSVFEESSLSSSSNQRIDEITKQDDDIIIGVVIGDDLDDDIKLKLNHDYADDFSSASIENLSKHKQEHIEFINLIKKCQHWIETITAKKFLYPNDFRKSLENGVLLCELLNALKKDSIRRINRYPTPIAGIDNLNVFLKACQLNFQLSQTNLFDIIDLEDLNKRRGYNNNINKDSNNDSTTITYESTNHSNQSKEIDFNSTNENLLDEEQQKRLKKVVNTIYWLSRKAIELGIPIAYNFEPNNHIVNNNNNCNSSNNNNTNYSSNSNLSLNQYSSSTSSSLSSSSSFISSSSSSSSSNNSSNHQLSVIVSTPLTSATATSTTTTTAHKSGPRSFTYGGQQLLLKKKYTNKSVDEIDSFETKHNTNENLNHQNNMSYIYKQQLQQQQINSNKNVTSASFINRKDSIDALDSISKNTLKCVDSNNDNNGSSNFTVSPSMSSSPGSTNNNNSNKINKQATNTTTNSQDDLQLIDSTMSPISSNNSAISPHLMSTSSSTNLSNSNLSNGINVNNNSNNKINSNIQTIPTRFVDRRVSTSVNQTYKFNYQEAGQKLARKAQEQLKTVEKCKEKNNDELVVVVANNKDSSKTVQTTNKESELSGSSPISDDWQNTVDDWKKRRREKVKMPPPRNGEIDDSLDHQKKCTKSDRKRINRFENSNYYIQPLTASGNNLDEMNEINHEIITKPEQDQEQEQEQEFVANNKENNKKNASTIEVSGIRNHQTEPTKSNNLNQSNLNDSIQPSDDISINDTSVCITNIKFNYIYVEKLVDLKRTDDYNLRGFGFLLKNGTSSTNCNVVSNDEKINFILSQNYAEIVGIDPHSLADKAGLKKGDLVVKINEYVTGNLSSEQLRKIMTDRLKMNSIQLAVLSLEKQEITRIEEEIEEDQIIIEEKTNESPKKSNNKNHLTNKSNNLQQLLVPKPYKKSLPSSLSNTLITSSSSSSNQNHLLQSIQAVEHETIKKRTFNNNNNNDDTDHDNDDVDSDELLLLSPPPIPATAPPPLPLHNNNKNQMQNTDLIKKELKDNMKCVENWKVEQELLMKQKYQEEQKRIEISLKTDLEKVKEEENQRREQERLKLEKEKLRLHELELKEREHELKAHLDHSSSNTKSTIIESNDTNKSPTINKSNESKTVRKEDLTALIEKIYTEQENEPDFLIEYTQPPTAKLTSPVRQQQQPPPPIKSNSSSSSCSVSSSSKQPSSSLISTKTSPIVAAALSGSCGDEEDEDMYMFELNKKINTQVEREILTDLIDTTTKHQLIKQVHDSMDNLKNQLLHKGMNKFADDVDVINKNLEATRKKQEELDRIKQEQEQIKKEKERIEQEKEKLKQEAEQLRIERELILMAATTKAAAAAAATANTPTSSSSSSSTTMNDHLEADAYINQDLYKQTSNYLNEQLNFHGFTNASSSSSAAINQLASSLSSSSLSPNRKYYMDNNKPSIQNNTWLIEEVERKRMTNPNQSSNVGNNGSLMTSQQQILLNQNYIDQHQRLRRSYPSLLSDNSNNFDSNMKSTSNMNYTNSQSGYINTPLSSTSGITKIYTKKKSSQSNSRPIKLQQQQHNRSNNPQSIISSSNGFYTNCKPPHSNQRLISNSSNDLKNVVKIHQNNSNKSSHALSGSTTSLTATQPPPPTTTVISLNQKCSNCSHALGQGSAMFIEKLSLAFHLKCFRCSVCNIPLGNGKEGTDVRVSVTNRLHCNNCFSNDLGVRLSAV